MKTELCIQICKNAMFYDRVKPLYNLKITMSEKFSEQLAGKDTKITQEDIDRLKSLWDPNGVLKKAQEVFPPIVFAEIEAGKWYGIWDNSELGKSGFIEKLDYYSWMYNRERHSIFQWTRKKLTYPHKSKEINNTKFHFHNQSSENEIWDYIDKVTVALEWAKAFLEEYIKSETFESRIKKMMSQNSISWDPQKIIWWMLRYLHQNYDINFTWSTQMKVWEKFIKWRAYTDKKNPTFDFHIFAIWNMSIRDITSLCIHEMTHTVLDPWYMISDFFWKQIDVNTIDSPSNTGKQYYEQDPTEFYARLMQSRKDLYDFWINIYRDISPEDIVKYLKKDKNCIWVFFEIFILEFNDDYVNAFKNKKDYFNHPKFKKAIHKYVEFLNTIP